MDAVNSAGVTKGTPAAFSQDGSAIPETKIRSVPSGANDNFESMDDYNEAEFDFDTEAEEYDHAEEDEEEGEEEEEEEEQSDGEYALDYPDGEIDFEDD